MLLSWFIMSYIIDPMTLRQMLLWLQQPSHKDVDKVNTISQECPRLMRSYYIGEKKINLKKKGGASEKPHT